jgi:plastocyanin
MTRFYLGILTLSALLISAAAGAADVAVKSGIVKGTITIAGKATSNVVVSIEGVPAESAKARLAAIKTKKNVMDQRDNKFVPSVLAVVVGSKVEFPNNDKSWHNVYSKGGAKDFDLGLYQPGKSRDVTFDKPGVARILCNAHPNMEAYIVIKEQPFFSTADKGGNYRIDGIPLGTYRVTVWHPELGVTEAGVELVRDGQVSDINFDLKKK